MLRKTASERRPGVTYLFRHACATHMPENGADIRYIQDQNARDYPATFTRF